MTFGSSMRSLASELTQNFSGELGLSTIKHLVGNAYDSVTGDSTLTYQDEQAYVVFSDIKSAGVADESYLKDHMQCVVAGDSLTFTPTTNDLIVSTDGKSHRVVDVLSDQYGAAHIMYVEKKHV